MKSIALVVLILCLCASCTVTLTGDAKWSEAATIDAGVPKEQYDKLLAEAQSFASEISAAADIDAVNAVLAKYGVARKEN